MTKEHFYIGAAVLAALVVFGACGGQRDGCNEVLPVRVAAAASLQRALPAILGAFERRSGVAVEVSFASSGRIAAQVEAGAPIDLMLSADTARIEDLVAKKRVRDETALVYARGRLAVVVAHGASLRGRDIEGLATPRFRRIGLANPELSPFGAAAEQALRRAGIWGAVEDRVVIGENVGQVYQYWRSGNVEAAFVPLALLDERDPRVVVSERLYDPLNQMLGITASAQNPEGAARLVRYLMSDKGQALLGSNGFAAAEPEGDTGRR